MKKKKQIKKIKHHSKNSKPIGKVAKLSIDNNILTVKYKYNEEYQKTILIATCPICNIKLNVNKDGIIKKCFNCGKGITPIFSFKAEPFENKPLTYHSLTQELKEKLFKTHEHGETVKGKEIVYKESDVVDIINYCLNLTK